MSAAQQKQSEKLNVIDRSTFDKIQEESSRSAKESAGVGRIRNSKYKKTHSTSGGTSCSLLQFLKQKPLKRAPSERRRARPRRRVVDTPFRQLKKRGKIREGGRKKHYSRLKKSILRYRRQKRQLEEATEQLEALSLVQSPPKEPKQVVGVHSRRFRAYCDNCTTPELSQLTEQLLRELDRFQRRAHAQNEIKAHAHRRFVVGFREMQNYLRINKVKLIIIAPDCEECAGEAGLDATIDTIKVQCRNQNVPYVFSLRRRQLAYALYKKVPIGCVAILDYDGARELFNQLMCALQQARDAYVVLLQHNGITTT